LRKSIIAAVVGVLALAFAATAYAVTVQTFTLKFTTTKRSSSTGFISKLTTRDAESPLPLKKSSPVSKVVITFPKGTTTNTAALPSCKLPDTASPAALKVGCPKAKIGSGTALINTGLPNAAFDPPRPNGIVSTQVSAYNKNPGKILFANQNVVSPLTFAGTIRGNVLTVNIPNGGKINPPINAVLTDFSLAVKAQVGKIGRKKVPYAVTPRTCPKSGKWTTKAVIYYSTFPEIGPVAPKTILSDTPCKK